MSASYPKYFCYDPLVRHIGDPPITPNSVYQVRLLDAKAFRNALNLATKVFGPPREPVWILPWNLSGPAGESIAAALDAYQVAADPDRVGYFRSADLVNRDLEVVWLTVDNMHELEGLKGDVLWERVSKLGTDDRAT